MRHVVFKNSGVLDPRSIITFGVSAKAGKSPIGYFGTGLKYAIAVLIRNGIDISVFSGERLYTFGKAEVTIRGTGFSLLKMCTHDLAGELLSEQELGFTTELGKNWTVRQAFRELYSNMLDESGTCELMGDEQLVDIHLEENTTIVVSGQPFIDVFYTKGETFLQTPAKLEYERMEVHSGEPTWAYYRGVRVHELQKPTRFTYNLVGAVELTEDRTLKYSFYFTDWLKYTISQATDEEFIEQVLICGENYTEHTLDFSSVDEEPSEAYMTVLSRYVDDRSSRINHSMITYYKRFSAKTGTVKQVELTPVELQQLDKARKFVENVLGMKTDTYPIYVVDFLGDDVLGLAENGCCFISRRVFRQGTKQVAATLYEEFLHLSEHLQDCTYGMQNYLFDVICSLGEQIQGEPL
jgi:hypothetical protein